VIFKKLNGRAAQINSGCGSQGCSAGGLWRWQDIAPQQGQK